MSIFRTSLGKRRQLFELQDYSWCPPGVREGITAYLGWNLNFLRLYQPIAPWIKLMAQRSSGKWIDLCAGSGGGSLPLHRKLGEIPLILTDLYPQKIKAQKNVEYYPHAVDAAKVPLELTGFRTLFTSFHHLPDPLARRILEDAFQSKSPIGVFEFTERNIFCLLMTAPNLILSPLFLPLVWPWKLNRFFWTYLIPLIPLFSTVDILMSCLRTRDPEELSKIIKGLDSEDYEWKIGQEKTTLGFKITYLVGLPR